MNKRNDRGLMVGEIDSDGVAEWYPNCKVRHDGSHYVALPHTENHARRRKRKEQEITVSELDGKYVPVNEPQAVISEQEISPQGNYCETEKVQRTTRKKIFDRLYDKYLSLKKPERMKVIKEAMRQLFKTEEELQFFLDEQFKRRKRNVVMRRRRFAYKAYNQHFQYFATFTYSDEKHTEASFAKAIIQCLRNFVKRKGWHYAGVWERGKDTDRLHFHCLLYVPEGTMCGTFETITDYNKKTGRRKTITQNTFFAKRFGRNEFDDIENSPYLYGKAVSYIMKYMEKTDTKVVYSHGLYEYFYSDIQGSDVVAPMSISDENNIKLVLADDFVCWNDGEKIGTVSPETIAKLPKGN